MKSKYVVVALAGIMCSAIIGKQIKKPAGEESWEEKLSSFEDHKNEIIKKGNRAIVKISGEQVEEVDLNKTREELNLNNHIGAWEQVDLNDVFNEINSFFDISYQVLNGNQKNHKNSKENKKKDTPSKKETTKDPVKNKSENKKNEEGKKKPRQGKKKIKLSTRGIIISEDGYVLTTYSSIKDCDKLFAEIEGKKYEVIVVAYDDWFNIALLKIKSKEKLPFLPIEQKKTIKYCYPLISNISCHYSKTITSEKENKNKEAGDEQKGEKSKDKKDNSEEVIYKENNKLNDILFLINSEGNLAGMTVDKGEGIGKCMGRYINVLNLFENYKVIDTLKTKKEYIHDICGLKVVSNTKKIANKKKLKNSQGCIIVNVDPKLKKDGFRIDDVILKVNNSEIYDIVDFYSIFKYCRNDDISFTVLQNDKIKNITVPFGKMSPLLFDSTENSLVTEKYTFNNSSNTQKALFRKNNIPCGVIIHPNKQNLFLKEDFIITKMEHMEMCDTDCVKKLLKSYMKNNKDAKIKEMILLVEGYYLKNLTKKEYFAINLL